MAHTEQHKEKIRQAHLARNKDSNDEICKMAIQGKSAKEIAKHFKKTTSNISKILAKRDIKAEKGENPRKGVSAKPKKVKEICDMAKQGKTAQEIANYYNEKGFKHSAGHIYKILDKNGIILKRNKSHNSNPGKIKEICDMYKNGKTIKEIANHFQCYESRISQVLLNNNLRSRRKPIKRPGYILDKQGYLWMKVSKDDPMTCMRTKSGLVLEHRLVMARKLNRPLLDYETVHHIDGNKENNNIENLQLRLGSHPAGQCMKCYDCNSKYINNKDWLHCNNCGSCRVCFSEI